jgi:hypothetical protein
MLGFISEELVWAIAREREEEARRAHPHTERRGDPERMTHEAENRRAAWSWNAPYLRASAYRA